MTGLSAGTRRLMVRNQILAKLNAAEISVETGAPGVATYLSHELVAVVDEIAAAAVAAFKVSASMALDHKATEWAHEFAETDSDADYGRWDAWENAARIVRDHPT